MREFFDRLQLRFAQFMEGRYGSDSLNKFLIILALIFVLLNMFIPILSIVGWILIALVLFRTFSKNHAARQRENAVYEKIIHKPKKAFKNFDTRWKNRKTTVYFKCKGCGTRLSVPKGKGKLRIVCPKCKKEIFKNT